MPVLADLALSVAIGSVLPAVQRVHVGSRAADSRNVLSLAGDETAFLMSMRRAVPPSATSRVPPRASVARA